MNNPTNSTCLISLLPHAGAIEARKGEKLIETLLKNNIPLRYDCGGKGVCGKCTVIIRDNDHTELPVKACMVTIDENIAIRIPERSLMSSHVIEKTAGQFPRSFHGCISAKKSGRVTPGIAIDLGTTTIAVHLCDINRGTILSSVSVKNPQSLYGDDVMSRISHICLNRESLGNQQDLVIQLIRWAINDLFRSSGLDIFLLEKILVVGNTTMIHILLGVNPSSIGVAPYKPQFLAPRAVPAQDVGLDYRGAVLRTLPQISAFLGSDILSSAVAVEFDKQPDGTLLIDLGTNGELILKYNNGYIAASCATGPTFEGACISCGMQASPGAIERVFVDKENGSIGYSVIQKEGQPLQAPQGICGSGVISAITAFVESGIIARSGAFTGVSTGSLKNDEGRYHVLADSLETLSGSVISISQKDIRAIQLGKAALVAGIELLLASAGLVAPEKVIIAGAFGNHLDIEDLITLGIIPAIEMKKPIIVGNAAGTGAAMALCCDRYIQEAQIIADNTEVVELANDPAFQDTFISHLSF